MSDRTADSPEIQQRIGTAYKRGLRAGRHAERTKRDNIIEAYIERTHHWRDRAKSAEGELRRQRAAAMVHGIMDWAGLVQERDTAVAKYEALDHHVKTFFGDFGDPITRPSKMDLAVNINCKPGSANIFVDLALKWELTAKGLAIASALGPPDKIVRDTAYASMLRVASQELMETVCSLIEIQPSAKSDATAPHRASRRYPLHTREALQRSKGDFARNFLTHTPQERVEIMLAFAWREAEFRALDSAAGDAQGPAQTAPELVKQPAATKYDHVTIAYDADSRAVRLYRNGEEIAFPPGSVFDAMIPVPCKP